MRLYFLLSALAWLFFFSLHPASLAQTPTPNNRFNQACDKCGWCPIEPNDLKPANWHDCDLCLYDGNVEKKYVYWTMFGCLDTNPSAVPATQSILRLVYSVAGGIAFIAFLIGCAIILTSSGNPIRIKQGKDILLSSIVGLLLILFSVFILRVIGLDVLRIPGIG